MESDRLAEIRALATDAHRNQFDTQGVPYIQHPLAVAEMVSEEAKPVALLHDVIEDTELGASDLRYILSPAELDAVLLVSREPGETYRDFIERIATARGEAGRLAREVKRADICHNLGRLSPELAGMERRYVWALARLAEVGEVAV